MHRGPLVETIMEDGPWAIRRQIDTLYNTPAVETWVSHVGCADSPRRVRSGKCHNCQAQTPTVILGFLDLVRWEK